MNVSYKSHGPRLSWFRWSGLDLLAVENECLRLVVWPDHGADLLEFRHKPTDLDVLWKNPYAWPPRSRALDQPPGGRSEFYDVFHGGWFVSLPNGFFPAEYYGAPLGCHGELQSVPWTAEILEQSSACVRVRLAGCSIRTPWMLERDLELRSGEPIVRWRDRLHNRSAQRLPVAWLHHPTFGGPLIVGARIVTPASTLLTPPSERPNLTQLRPGFRGSWPLAPEQDGRLRDCSRMPSRERAAEHVVHLTDFSTGWAALWNDQLQLGLGLGWDERVFPYAWLWAKSHGKDTYPLWGAGETITLQPSTSPLRPFPDLLAANEVLWLDGNASVETSLIAGFIGEAGQVLLR